METLNYRRAEKSEKAFEENPKARSQINNKKNKYEFKLIWHMEVMNTSDQWFSPWLDTGIFPKLPW